MRDNHIVGLTAAIANPDYRLIKDAGIEWLRHGISFPWQDKVNGKYSERYQKGLDKAKQLTDQGFKLLGNTIGPGSYRYDEQVQETIWKTGMPDWAGTYNDDHYYEIVEEACAEMASKTKGMINLWKVANEPDIDIFRGPLSDEQIVRFLLAAGWGVKQGNPDAKVGINLGFLTDYSRWLMRETYNIDASPFDVIGVDGYFGSWHPGGPNDWVAYIDEVWEITGKPILVVEWGYSSLQSTPKTDDPKLEKSYNQGVCKSKSWDRVWKKEHSPLEQADYIREGVKIFADHPHVIGNFFFRWSDTSTCWQCGQPGCPAEVAWGIVDVEGNPKPGYYALKESIKKYFK